MRSISIVSFAGALLAGSASSAAASSPLPSPLEGEASFEVAEGEVYRGAGAPKSDRPPAEAEADFRALSARTGSEWRAMWDRERNVPQRLFGAGTAAPGASDSPAAAAAHAERALEENLALLAPGAEISDFELAVNHRGETGMRTVVFHQYHDGVQVLGGHVNFRFRSDRLFMIASQAYPHVEVPRAAASVRPAVARDRAAAWIQREFGAGEAASEPSGPYVLPIVRAPGEIEYHTVQSVPVEARSIPALWDVYVDAATGEEIARRQRIHFGSGYVDFDVPERRPGDGRTSLPASFLEVNVEGLTRFADALGRFTWGAAGSRDVSFGMRGEFVDVDNDQGASAEFDAEFSGGDEETFSYQGEELLDAQVSLYAHVNFVREYVRQYSRDPWLEETLDVRSNVDDPLLPFDTCNAFFNPGFDDEGQHLGFLAAGTVTPVDEDGDPIEDPETGDPLEIECNNSGLIADIIYHEYGHAIHENAYLPGTGIPDQPLSEGISDYLAVTITDDPTVGEGLFVDHPLNDDLGEDEPLRHLDPEAIGEERRVFPDDFEGEPETVHSDGLIIGQTLWELREALIEEHGEEAGVARADRIWYGVVQGAEDMFSAYAEALAADDEDGNLETGTPNSCLITRVFSEAGLGFGDGVVVPGIERPELRDHEIHLDVRDPAGCDPMDIGVVEAHWRYRGGDSGGTLEMNQTSSGYEVALPARDEILDGEEGAVVEYQVEVRFENGETAYFPQNPADPYYEAYVGPTGEIYCADLESDPFDEDRDAYWEREDRDNDDVWEWGAPQSRGLGGAPTHAYEGESVLATDLGDHSDGLHPAGWSELESPEIEFAGHDEARLQFRRWLAAGGEDEARIYVNGDVVWERADETDRQDAADDGRPEHRDREWIFQDIDLTPYVEESGEVQVRFEYEAEEGDEHAGWAIDDFCVVVPEESCPDFEDGETCPPGGCPTGCPEPEEFGGEPPESGGCAAGAGGGAAGGLLALVGLLAAAVRRRRAAAA